MKDVRGKRKFLSVEELKFLNQMVSSLEQSELKLEQAYRKKKPNQFNAVKQFVLKLNKKIADYTD